MLHQWFPGRPFACDLEARSKNHKLNLEIFQSLYNMLDKENKKFKEMS